MSNSPTPARATAARAQALTVTTRLLRIGMILCLAAAMLIFVRPAYAGTRDIEAANNQVSAQLQRTQVNYSETVNDSAGNEAMLDNENGAINGYGVSASMMKNLWLGRDYLFIQYRSFKGRTNYTGGTLPNPAFGSSIGESGASIRDFSLRYGAGYPQDRTTLLTLFAELGNHKYLRTLGLGTTGAYQETYWHNYLGLGAMLQYSPSESWVYSVQAMIGHTFQSRMDAVFQAPYNQLSVKLGNSSIEKLEFQADYAITRSFHANAAVELMTWSYGASGSQQVAGASLFEPNSTTFTTAARVGVGYAF
jgi:hypothetical protein